MAVEFTRETCPYTWRASYGAAYNTALARWSTTAYRASHAYTAAKTERVAAGMRQGQEVQTCAGYQTFHVDTGIYSADQATVRVQQIETDTSIQIATGKPGTSTGTELVGYTLIRTHGRWLINADANDGG